MLCVNRLAVHRRCNVGWWLSDKNWLINPLRLTLNLALQVLVETAMFAAVGGLAFSIAAVLKLQGYLGYLLPMPIVLSAMRSGPAVGRKATVATATLLLGQP